jgi:hypothetical protein
MKRVTITYTRQNEETPWYWQIAPEELDSTNNFLSVNNDKVENYTIVTGNKHIVSFNFNNQQIFDEFVTLIETDVKTGYKQYCDDNNITIDVVTEDV